MALVRFFFNVSSREGALCQMAGKVVARGQRAAILTASAAVSQTLDALLWQQPKLGFLPHCPADADIAAATPIVLDHRAELLPACDVLFNWSGQIPVAAERYAQVVELVARDDEEQKLAARQLYRAYQAAGWQLETTDMADRRD